ncbi:hypothetical protein JCM10213_004094 [Rhodosporidiobolus nylandii]
MDDELDPAFLDLDLPSHGSGLGDSLGAGFGAPLDLDLDDDEPQFSGSGALGELGSGFGALLGDELDGEPGSTSRSRHSSAQRAHGASGRGAGSQADSGFATPRRRNGSGASLLDQAANGGGGNRMSLAFELASASGPPGGRTRDLMRELGIEEDDSEEQHYEEDEEAEEEDEFEAAQQQVGRRLFGGNEADEARDDPFGAAGVGASPGRRPASRMLRAKSSTASFASFAPGGEEATTPKPEGISQEELDAALKEATDGLQASMATTGTFLSHLRQHVTVEVDPSSAPPAPSLSSATLEPSSSSSILLSGSLQRSTSTPSPLAPSPPSEVDYTDRQPLVESLASSVLKRMYAVAAQREQQTRALTEMERVFARNEGGWRAVLAGLEPLPPDEDEAGEGDGDATVVLENGVSLTPEEPVPSSPFLDGAPPPASSRVAPPPSAASEAQHQLHDLRSLTTSLLSALSSISDLSQVQSALSSDAGRKLRALKVQVGGVKDDLSAVERAEEFVREYEAREAQHGKRDFAEMARREMQAAQEALEVGWRKAQSVFQVPQRAEVTV